VRSSPWVCMRTQTRCKRPGGARSAKKIGGRRSCSIRPNPRTPNACRRSRADGPLRRVRGTPRVLRA
jgi:hypothetical protein